MATAKKSSITNRTTYGCKKEKKMGGTGEGKPSLMSRY